MVVGLFSELGSLIANVSLPIELELTFGHDWLFGRSVPLVVLWASVTIITFLHRHSWSCPQLSCSCPRVEAFWQTKFSQRRASLSVVRPNRFAIEENVGS
ncbi:hypothetical protein CSKR_106018 [Clonorchis sinensis]|uniref:Uncharacterized protein n=1 Tax=Clonorchis sinensis TaxID=79923 RepID=A0A3R7JG24_CLOSI|nr:hypothetical protein CSKR_106018 [Clonorchis sinensis]